MRLLRYLRNDLWTADLRSLSLGRRITVGATRIVLHAVEAFTSSIGAMRPAGLTMITLLALVPLLAITTSIANALGYDESLQQFIDANTRDLPENLLVGVRQLREAVERADFQALGLISTGVLVWTILTLFTRVEAALNYTWKARKARPWLRRISDFIALIILFPVLAILALVGNSVLTGAGWIQQLQEHAAFGLIYQMAYGGITHVVMWGAMTALFRFMPSAEVRWVWALIGGIVAGSGWLLTHEIWISLQIGMARANAIYATVAAFPLLILYLQTVWTVVLFGAEVAYAGQHIHVLGPNNTLRTPSHAVRERIALALVERACARFQSGGGATPMDTISRNLDVAPEWVEEVCITLEAAGLIAFVDRDGQMILPAKPVEAMQLHAVIDAMRGLDEDTTVSRIELSPSTSSRLRLADEQQRSVLEVSALAPAPASEPGHDDAEASEESVSQASGASADEETWRSGNGPRPFLSAPHDAGQKLAD